MKFLQNLRVKREQPPPLQSYFAAVVDFTSPRFELFGKRETDVIEITTFLPASDSLFGSRFIFKQSYLTVELLHLCFQRNGKRETSSQKISKYAV